MSSRRRIKARRVRKIVEMVDTNSHRNAQDRVNVAYMRWTHAIHERLRAQFEGRTYAADGVKGAGER